MTRRTAWLPVLLSATLALAACGGDPEPEPDTSATGSSAPATPEANEEPSEEAGQEREDTTPPEVTGTIATGLEAPWGLAFLPDGSAVVTERDTTRVLHLTQGGGDEWQVEEAGVVDQAEPAVEGGLLGVAVSPEFEQDETIYLYLTTADDNRVVRATLADGDLGETTPVLTGIPRGFTHDGGRIEFGPDGHLYVSTGEIGEPDLAQDRDSLAGKILRITTDGEPAPGNPDADSPVWSWGHRNVQGLAWDEEDQLWASEFGANTADELNRIEAGANYGWPLMEGEEMTGNGAVDDLDLVDPVLTWPTSEASPSGLAYAEGSLWLAALRGNRLWQVHLDDGANGGEPRPEAHLVGEYGRLRTVVAAPDGTLWVTTSNRDGRGDPARQDDRILQVTP